MARSSDPASSSAEPDDSGDAGLANKVRADERWRAADWTFAHRLRCWWRAASIEPAAAFHGPIEDPPLPPEQARIGISCSGGGIRSASFNLGALQELGPDMLQRAHYLAAVSGGSYIAGAFAMVAKTSPNSVDGDSDESLVTHESPPFYPGSPEEQYLRNRVSYLAPAGGGRIRLVWRIVCGLLINLLIITSVIFVLAAGAALYYRHQDPNVGCPPVAGAVRAHIENQGNPSPHCASPADARATPNVGVWGVGLGLIVLASALGLSLVVARPRRDATAKQIETWSLRLLAAGLVLLAFDIAVPALLVALRQWHRLGDAGQVVGGGISATLVGILVTVLTQVRTRVGDPREAIAAVQKDASWVRKLTPRLQLLVINGAAYVFGPLLLLAVFVGATLAQITRIERYWLAVWPAVALIVFTGLYFLGDLTSWSLHPFYRRRLCTAFALRRVSDKLDPARGIAVEREQELFDKLSTTRVVPDTHDKHWPSDKWPTLIVCAAANVSDPGATPPGRSVTSFTFSCESIGGPLIGGIRTEEFERHLSVRRARDLNLPAVMAMSGAALSPSMGKHTHPSLRFLLGLANVRLGVWVVNPRRLARFVNVRQAVRAERWPSRRQRLWTFNPLWQPSQELLERLEEDGVGTSGHAPRPRPIYLLKELLGMASVNDKFLYITDGGHYENLGLVELLRRGCTRIYCFDASGGRGLDALGDAIALARAELGVEIEFASADLDALREDATTGFAKKACAVGTIKYSGSPGATGALVYAPTVMTPDLPVDLLAFKRRDSAFPHHSTVDQLFTDQKFEAYRVLGRHAAQAAVKAMEEYEWQH